MHSKTTQQNGIQSNYNSSTELFSVSTTFYHSIIRYVITNRTIISPPTQHLETKYKTKLDRK